MPLNPPERILMGPGPSSIPQRVLSALAKPTIGHLDPYFCDLMDELKQQLRRVFLTENEMTFAVSAPGSVGMEICFVNLLEPGDEVVICRNGVFGDRMASVASRIGAQVISVDDEWGTAVSPDKVESILKKHPHAKVLAFVHVETSTGVQSDAQALCQLARKYDCLTLVDTVTSLGGCPVRVDDWQMDAVYSGSQKCLSCVPGLSPVTFSDRAMKTIANRTQPTVSWFLDLNLIRGYWHQKGGRTYHHTAPVNNIYALHESLSILLEEGLEGAWNRHQSGHQRLEGKLAKLGLEFFVPSPFRAWAINAVQIPANIDDLAIRQKIMSSHSIEIGAGLGAMAGKVWRIGIMGHSCQNAYIDSLACALADALNPTFV